MKRILIALGAIISLVVLGVAPASSLSGQDTTRMTPGVSFPDPGLLINPAGSGYHRYYVYKTSSSKVTSSTGHAMLRIGYIATDRLDTTASVLHTYIRPADPSKWWVDMSYPGDFWAPHVFYNGSQYVMYFSAKTKKSTQQRCIGAAYSTSPAGPFTPVSTPLMCPATVPAGWARMPQNIDPAMYYDTATGKRYLIAKRYCCNSGYSSTGDYLQDSEIYGRQVTASGLALASGTSNFSIKRLNDAPTIEAPSIVSAVGKLWLFVSRNAYDRCTYKTQVYSAPGMGSSWSLAETTMAVGTPSGTDLCGDGGLEAQWDPQSKVMRMVFHAFYSGASTGKGPGPRELWSGCLGWGSGVPRVVSCP